LTAVPESKSNFADRLIEGIARKGAPIAVAIDPVFESLPAKLQSGRSRIDSVMAYCREVLEVISPVAPVVKINSAYFECYGWQGVRGYFELVFEARQRGMVVIGDVKRGDVGHTAQMYAEAHLSDSDGVARPDAATISGYFGIDGAKPFIDIARSQGKGLFVLVRTSNPSAADLQDARMADGRMVHEQMAGQVASWASDSSIVGSHGYSSIGAVAATRAPIDAANLRRLMPKSILLVPGYGAQGGKAADYRPYFDSTGGGALVAAGRSVIFAYRETGTEGGDWRTAVDAACRKMAAEVAAVVNARDGQIGSV
jgi:orotidine-5'-phosphate decarboxylase